MQNYTDVKIKSVEVVTITPELAAKMLQKNDGNRKISANTILCYSNDMKSGRWKQTHQGMAVDESGKIIDGQHRLSAIVKSGLSMVTTLTTFEGDLNTIFIPIDRGKNRTISDLTGILRNEMGVISSLCYFFSGYGNKFKVDPVVAMSLYNDCKEELSYIKDVTGLSISTNGGKYKVGNLLERIWITSVKCAVLISVFDNVDISVIKDFQNEIPKSKANREFLEWKMDQVSTGGGSASVVLICMFWNVLRYKKFILPNNFDEIDKNKAEIRTILKKRFPEIFGK